MRAFRTSFLTVIIALAGACPLQAQTPGAPAQSLFLGQRLCGDTRDICYVAVSFALHRYLHIVLRSVPGDTDWRVQAARQCGEPMGDIAGGAEVPASGYLETVVDLAATDPPRFQQPACFAFRGHAHWYVSYYAAYLDDSPVADADAVYPGYENLAGRPDLPDLDVTYIHRDPAYPYDAPQNAPRTGQVVTFTAHILNAGGLPAAPAPFEWLLDGRTIARGQLSGPLPAQAETTVTLPWKWDPGMHSLEFRVQPAAGEISAANDALTVRTDALALGFWVERSAWKYFLDRQWEYCVPLSCTGSDSFPDWLQRQVKVWNGMLANAGYDYPDPVLVADRVRVDKIVVVPDGALPLHGGLPTNDPDITDHTVDLEWGLPAAEVEHAYRDGADGPFNVDLGLMEELSHARSLADLYRFDLQVDGRSVVEVRAANGKPAFDPANPFDASRPLHAFYSDAAAPYLYADAENDLMSCTCTRSYSPYDALLLNRLRGRRARCGNVNAPCNLGDWFGEQPAVTRIRVLDIHGRVVPDGTPVRLFFDSGQGLQDHRFAQSDGVTLSTAGGRVQLPRDPFRAGGDNWRAGHNLLLIEVATAQRDAFCFLEPATLNLASWLGYRDAHHPAIMTLDLRRIARNACNLALPPPRVNDPFATSPAESRARATGSGRIVSVALRADAPLMEPMRGRVVRVLDSRGQTLAQGTTDARGMVRLRSRRAPSQVVDVTDNDLVIPLVSSAPPARAVQRR